jgi:ketosteroid isomerase-like protein
MSKTVIEQFYQSFSEGNAEEMNKHYHERVIFNDPVFKNLDHAQVTSMWKMLIERSKGDLEITFDDIIADEEQGSCTWEARYHFSKTKRPVHNVIHASIQFKEGKIIQHTDTFNFWRWASMALGTPGKLLGWSPFLKNQVQKNAIGALRKYMA